MQSVGSSLPVGEVELAGQAKQKELEFAPAIVEYVPAEQSLHADAPVTSAYWPAPQTTHDSGPASGLYLPGTHSAHVPPAECGT